LMVDILDLFDNREKAIAIWLLTFAIGALFIRDIRRQLPGLLKTMFAAALVFPFLFAVTYVGRNRLEPGRGRSLVPRVS
jgi:hypothetical protein